MTTNPGMSGTSTGVLPSASHSARGPRAGLRARLRRERQLDELHPRHRVEHVKRDEALRMAARLRELGDRQRRGRRREHRVAVGGAGHLAEVGEHLRLAAVVLDDRLDEERRVVEAAEVGDHLDAAGVAALVLSRPPWRPTPARARRIRPSAPRAARRTPLEAVAARPHAIVPAPAMPSRSVTGGYSTGPFFWMMFRAHPHVI